MTSETDEEERYFDEIKNTIEGRKQPPGDGSTACCAVGLRGSGSGGSGSSSRMRKQSNLRGSGNLVFFWRELFSKAASSQTHFKKVKETKKGTVGECHCWMGW